MTAHYQALNLYRNFEQAATDFPHTRIIHDEALPAFPEMPLTTTYQETLALIKKRAYQLAQLGITQGEPLIIFKSPKFDTYLLAVAASYLGAVPVMISYHFPVKTMNVFVERLDHPYVLFDEQTAAVAKELTHTSLNKVIALADLLKQPEKMTKQAFSPEDHISYMTHTSGTTGIPKLICHSAQSMGWRTLWQKTIFEKIEQKELVAFHISPVHSRFNIGISSLMAMGFPMMPINQANIDSVAPLLKKHAPIALETHPNNFVQWQFAAKTQPDIFSSIKYYHSTFDAINNGTMSAFLEASQANDPLFLQVYGQSECGPMILNAHTLLSLPHNNARNMGVGLGELTRARVTDENGQEVPPHHDGHIHFLSKGRALTYYKEDSRFQETVYGKWWDSGDWGMMDETGHLYLKDRQVDVIASINSNLAIEDLLLDTLDFLAEVVIVRDANGYPQPLIALAPGCKMDWQAWWQAIADLPHLNEPMIKDFDEIPRTATMKVQRLQIEQALKENSN